MSNPNRVAGQIFFKVDGQQYSVKGGMTCNLGRPKREGKRDASYEHYYTEKPQVPFIEGEIIDRKDLDVAKFLDLDGVTVTLELANGKTITLRNAWQAGDGNGGTEEASIAFKLEGKSAEEVR